jgi:hypothetical protein
MTAFELHPSRVYCIAVMAILNLCRQFYTKKSQHAHYTVCCWLCYMCAGRILEYVGGPARHIAGLTDPSVWHTFFLYRYVPMRHWFLEVGCVGDTCPTRSIV